MNEGNESVFEIEGFNSDRLFNPLNDVYLVVPKNLSHEPSFENLYFSDDRGVEIFGPEERVDQDTEKRREVADVCFRVSDDPGMREYFLDYLQSEAGRNLISSASEIRTSEKTGDEHFKNPNAINALAFIAAPDKAGYNQADYAYKQAVATNDENLMGYVIDKGYPEDRAVYSLLDAPNFSTTDIKRHLDQMIDKGDGVISNELSYSLAEWFSKPSGNKDFNAQCEIFDHFLSRGGNINATTKRHSLDPDPEPALNYAISNHSSISPQHIQALVERGADPNLKAKSNCFDGGAKVLCNATEKTAAIKDEKMRESLQAFLGKPSQDQVKNLKDQSQALKPLTKSGPATNPLSKPQGIKPAIQKPRDRDIESASHSH